MKNKQGKYLVAIFLMLSLTFSGCALFKKKCDCPPVGKRRAAVDQMLPLV